MQSAVGARVIGGRGRAGAGGGDRRAKLLVAADGAEFVDPDARREDGEYWAAMAVDAAERHVRFD